MSDNKCKLCLEQYKISDYEIVYADENWLVKHSRETNIVGYLVLQSKRHFLDLTDANQKELSSYGPILNRLFKALKKTLSPRRIYSFTLAEMVPHLHVHIIPVTQALPKAFRGRGIMNYPTEPIASRALVENFVLNLKHILKSI